MSQPAVFRHRGLSASTKARLSWPTPTAKPWPTSYFRRDPNEARQAGVLLRDEARRTPAGIMRLPELMGRPPRGRTPRE